MYLKTLMSFLLAGALGLPLSFRGWADEARVAVASNFSGPLKELVTEFQKGTGHQVTFVAGATGKLAAQISQGAPFDIFLSADQESPVRLENEGQVVPGSRFTYALGRLVLWSSKTGFAKDGSEVLKKGNFSKIAIANPLLAPYGRAALEVFKYLNVESEMKGRTVLGENIAQAFQFVSTGAADLGLVARSQLSGAKMIEGSAWLVPSEYYSPILQDAALLSRAKDNPAARGFLIFLKSDRAREKIRAAGYDVP